jgi:amidohydrolase
MSLIVVPDEITELADASERMAESVAAQADELIEIRRDLHAHPELSWQESRTTQVAMGLVQAAGWRIRPLAPTGFVAELGEAGPVIGLRADLDALPIADLTEDPWVSTVAGVAHACGHDVHTTGLIGAARALTAVHHAKGLPGRVRLIFQPAEEVMPGGARRLIESGVHQGLQHVFALHCDPSLDIDYLGVREGAITGAADLLEVRLEGKGGHTSRPHLTQDLTFALSKLITELPTILSRRMDPRAGVSVVWGIIQAGNAPNVIPASGRVSASVRMLDAVAWSEIEGVIRQIVPEILAPYGVQSDVLYTRGVPPVVNERHSTRILGEAIERVVGSSGRVSTAQSLGGEDFGWLVESVPGAMARLGTRTVGGQTFDLHQGNLRVDERATLLGARVLAEAAYGALVTAR